MKTKSLKLETQILKFKTSIVFLVTLLLFFITQFTFAQPTIHTVDNRPESGAMFTTIQAAIDAAVADDIIHVHPTDQTYYDGGANITIDKTLTIIALGHNLLNETNNYRAPVWRFYIAAPNIVIQGMYIVTSIQAQGSDATGLKLINNHIAGNVSGVNSVGDNWEIRGNYFIIGNYGVSISQGTASNWIIANNFFKGSIIDSLEPNTIFSNNIVVHVVHNSNLFSNCDNPTVTNNLFLYNFSQSPGALLMPGSSIDFSNCLLYDYNGGTIADLPQQAGATNYNNMEPVFENIPTSITDFYNNDYRLATGSPGEDGGSEGTDIGVFGLNFNFDVDGRPDLTPYPTLINITNPLVIPGQDLNVLFQASQKQ